ncbi:MAG TPA: hypothetical protein V6D19_13945 [Stenomitos sp.]
MTQHTSFDSQNVSDDDASRARAGEKPNASGGSTPSTTEDHIPSTSEPYATDLPSANTPDPNVANPETNPNAALKTETE